MKQRLIAGFVLALSASLSAQIPNLPRDLLDRVPSLASLLQGEPLTTSMDDATSAVPMLDDYVPRGTQSMITLPIGPGGGFLLSEPGVFEGAFDSFCLQPGAGRPRANGDGYLSAPLKGPGSAAIGAILRGASDYPGLAQNDIQILLWGLLSRSPIDSMSPEVQSAARTLLTPAQIARANGGALARIPEEVRDALLDRASDAMRPVLDAEDAIRGRLADGAASFEELEAIAVPEPPGPDDDADPPARWSYDARGYFVRYTSEVYSEVRVVVARPAPVTIDRDVRGRITRVAKGSSSIEIRYDDSRAARVRPREATAAAVAIASARVTRAQDGIHRRPETAAIGSGWTFASALSTAASEGSFPDWDARLKDDEALVAEMDEFASRWSRAHAALRPMANRAIDLLRLRRALRLAAASSSPRPPAWAVDQLDLLAESFQFALCTAAGGCGAPAAPRIASLAPRSLPGNAFIQADNGSPPEADPSADVSVPPDAGKQRLGKSKKPKRCPTSDDLAKLQKEIDFDELAQQLLRNYINSARPDGYANDADGLSNWLKDQLSAATGAPIITRGTSSGPNTASCNVDCGPNPTLVCDAVHVATCTHEFQHDLDYYTQGKTGDDLNGKETAAMELRGYKRTEDTLKSLIDGMKKRCP